MIKTTDIRYQQLKTLQAQYDAWAEQFRQKSGWVVIPAEQAARCPVVFTNEDRTEIELYEWQNDPPADYFLYINVKTRQATTWTGAILGSVGFGRVWRDNFGGTRQSITVYGTNGRTYHGTYYKSSGDYARIKAAKYQKLPPGTPDPRD